VFIVGLSAFVPQSCHPAQARCIRHAHPAALAVLQLSLGAGEITVNVDPRFYRVAAICSFVSVATTLMLIFLPELFAPAPDFPARMERIHEGAYQARSWAYLVHPFVVFTAALGVALAVGRRAPVLAIGGVVAFTLWAFNEAGQQTLTLFAFDKWRAAWEAADQTTRATIQVNATMYDGIWDGMYALLLIGFAIGNACLATALLGEPGLARVVGALMLAAVALTAALFFGELGIRLLPATALDGAYPAIQPLGRALIGVWLWRQGRRG
jgi:hypothetical protein